MSLKKLAIAWAIAALTLAVSVTGRIALGDRLHESRPAAMVFAVAKRLRTYGAGSVMSHLRSRYRMRAAAGSPLDESSRQRRRRHDRPARALSHLVRITFWSLPSAIHRSLSVSRRPTCRMRRTGPLAWALQPPIGRTIRQVSRTFSRFLLTA